MNIKITNQPIDMLNSINNNLRTIAFNTGDMATRLQRIEPQLKRIADAAEVAAGIKTKEEIQTEQAIEWIKEDDIFIGNDFDRVEDYPKQAREKHEQNLRNIEKLRSLHDRLIEERIQKLIEQEGKK